MLAAMATIGTALVAGNSGGVDARGAAGGPAREAWRQAREDLRADFPVNPLPVSRITLTIWRIGQRLKGKPGVVAFLARRVVQVADAIWIRGLMGAELPTAVPAGPGLRLPHGGRGVIIHVTCSIGARAVIYHRTTIGVRKGNQGPRLGDDVFIGTGAVVLGAIVVADRTSVGANAVLLEDTEPGSTYVGVAARRVRG